MPRQTPPKPTTTAPSRPEGVWEQAAADADLTLWLPGDVPMFFCRIPKGEFLMGSRGYSPDEEPIHRVVIDHDFYLGTFVVTQEQYRAVAEQCAGLKANPEPSLFKGPRNPVEHVGWSDANAFCDFLSRGKQLSSGSREVRLPTEAEWEYACRAGSETDYYHGDGEGALAEVGWYYAGSGHKTHPVDERAERHPLGLHGMHGNVWEWCRDVYDHRAYRKHPSNWIEGEWTVELGGSDAQRWNDDARKTNGLPRVLRGGSWDDFADECRSACRHMWSPDVPIVGSGFRVCLVRGRSANEAGEAKPGRRRPRDT